MEAGQPMQVELPDGQVIWARIAVDGLRNVDAAKFVHLDGEELRRTVHGLASTVAGALRALTPDQVQVEFGLELALRAGKLTSMLAEAGTTATIKVALTWNGGPPLRDSASPVAT